MGFPKHQIRLGRQTIVAHIIKRLGAQFDEILLVGSPLPDVSHAVRHVGDLHSIRSPLAGIHSGLVAARTDLCFVMGCDMPHALPDLVRMILSRAIDADVTVPVVNGFYEPLFAAYHRSATSAIETAIAEARYKITGVYDNLRVLEVPENDVRAIDPALRSFANINTQDELATLREEMGIDLDFNT